MAIAEAYTGSETVGTTEHDLPSDTTSLSAITTDGIYQCFLDLSALTATETYDFRVYEKVAAGGTQRKVFTATFTGAQSDPHWVSPSLILMHGWAMSLDKIAGTDRSITWSIRSVS